MKKIISLLFCFLMLSASLAGCFGGDEDGEDHESEDEDGEDHEDETIEVESDDQSEDESIDEPEDEVTAPVIVERAETQPPVLIAPQEGWEVTDYALAFTWQRQSYYGEEDAEEETVSNSWSIDKYQLQASRTTDFATTAIDVMHDAPGVDQSRVQEGDEFDEESQEIKSMLIHWTETSYLPNVTLEDGTWYWRVRAADIADQNWSTPISFTITSDNTKIAPTRIISPEAPLFSFDMYDSDGGGWGNNIDWGTYWGFFPDDVKPYVAFAVPHEGWGDYASPARGTNGEVVLYSEFIQPLTDLDIPVLIKTGGPDGDPQNYLSTTELEDLYRNHPNVQGVVTGENTWQAIDGWNNPVYREFEVKWWQNVIKISGKYGKYVVAGEGSYAFAWDKYLGVEAPENNLNNPDDYVWLDTQIIIDNPSTFIPTAKSNIFWSMHHMDSAVFGASIANLVEHHGVWAEAWYWNDAGYSKGVFSNEFHNNADFSTMPFTTWLQTMLKGVARGATVYHFGGESGVSENRGNYDAQKDAIVDDDGNVYYDEDTNVYGDQYSSFWDMDGHVTLGFQRYIVPFMQAVVHDGMIPSKEQVRSEIKIAIDPGTVESDKGNFICYGHFTALYVNTYGIENMMEITADMEEGVVEESTSGCRYELIANNGRYYSIPIIPHPAISYDIGDIQLVSIDDLQSNQAVIDLFNSNYPDRFTGDAWMNQVGNVCYVTNSHENTNTQQTFGFSFNGVLKSLSGNSMPHSYLMASTNAAENSIWIHANAEHGPEYTDNRTTVLEMEWTSEPSTVTVTPSTALASQSWDESTGKLTLSLSHSSGSVTVNVAE
ncbi:MAG: glycoside hydrolase family 98 domain-containing protein [Candidatus Poseidoniales archaeon]